MTVRDLRCEYRVNPLGIDEYAPRLSWKTDGDNHEKQSEYRIIVSEELNSLENNKGECWDTGYIKSEESTHVVYRGKKQEAGHRYFWRVIVRDEKGVEYRSSIGNWSISILAGEQRMGKWISRRETGTDEVELEFKKGADKWIWADTFEKIGKAYLRKKIIIERESIISAKILITADEGFILFINGKKAGESDKRIFSWCRPVLADIKMYLKEGVNIFAVEAYNTYLDKPGVCCRGEIITSNNETITISSDERWEGSDTAGEGWKENENSTEWRMAALTGVMGDMPWRVPKHSLKLLPAGYFRREFIMGKAIKRAEVTVCALGIYELCLNNKRISDEVLSPGWPDYKKRAYYRSYEVTEMIKKGKNCIAVRLGEGWYSGYTGWERGREYYGNKPKLLLLIQLEYSDNTKDIISSDERWRVSEGGGREGDILMGERYDAIMERSLGAWKEAGYDDSGWEVPEAEERNIVLPQTVTAHPGEPIRRREYIEPKEIIKKEDNRFIFDMGVNFAGAAKLKVKGERGEEIVLRFGEMLDDKGELYRENLRNARAEDSYVCEGTGEEEWEPAFTYHGFRYIEMSGYSGKPDKETITGRAVYSDLERTGWFRCSDDRINRIYESAVRSQKSNYVDIPTDCPQRDERLGWTADAVDFIRMASYNMNTAAFFTKWLIDLNDEQNGAGAYPAAAPKPALGAGPLYPGAAGWADAGIITPYTLYRFYGDRRVLERYYDNMKLFMDYMLRNSNDYLRPKTGYGDWLSIDAVTPEELISTAFFAYDAKLMGEISDALGRFDEGDYYRNLFDSIKIAYNKKFINAEGKVEGGTQTGYVLTLHFGLSDDKRMIDYLVKDIEERGWHISTGFIGLQFVFDVLDKYGREDVIYKILLNSEFPGWVYMIDNGGTTLWERWDSYRAEKGIYDPLMNSFNHTSLGAPLVWLYTGIGGIREAEAGFKKVIIAPKPGGGVTWAETAYESIRGRIETRWRTEGRKFFLEVKVPAGIESKIILPEGYEGIVLSSKF